MKAIEFIYQDTQIHFALGNDQNVMVNATEMAKAFNKRIENFTRIENTKSFISECLKNANKRYLNIKTESDLIDSRQKSGTYMHRILALKFAAWLDPAFELWVFSTIDEILFGNYNKHSQAILEKLKAEKDLENLENELLENPKFEKYLQIQKLIKTTDAEKQKAIKAQINQIKMDFSKK